MTEPNDIVFMEPVEAEPVEPRKPAPNGGGPGRQSTPVRIGIVAGTALLVVLGAAVAMGASPAPSTAPGASAAPGATAAPGTSGADKDGDRGFGMRGGDVGMRGGGFHDITIASISGSSLSLKTADGWTRTITPTSTTTITKAGATITVSDLEVGDQIVFSQTKQTDGTYTIDAIRVILPSVGGQVSAVSGNTITVTQRDGTTATIHVDSATTYQVEGVTSATLSDIKVGDFVWRRASCGRTARSTPPRSPAGSAAVPAGAATATAWGPTTGTTARPPAPRPPRPPRRADLRSVSSDPFHAGRGAAALGARAAFVRPGRGPGTTHAIGGTRGAPPGTPCPAASSRYEASCAVVSASLQPSSSAAMAAAAGAAASPWSSLNSRSPVRRSRMSASVSAIPCSTASFTSPRTAAEPGASGSSQAGSASPSRRRSSAWAP